MTVFTVLHVLFLFYVSKKNRVLNFKTRAKKMGPPILTVSNVNSYSQTCVLWRASQKRTEFSCRTKSSSNFLIRSPLRPRTSADEAYLFRRALVSVVTSSLPLLGLYFVLLFGVFFVLLLCRSRGRLSNIFI
jgi:hypothetical protein